MWKLKETPLRRTVRLVETRIKSGESEDPLQDLAFLCDYYLSRGEFDKANATTRHMLEWAEGNRKSRLEITPIDVGLLADRKRYEKMCCKLAARRLFVLLLTCFLVATPFFVNQQHPEWFIQARATLCPWDAAALLSRAQYNIYPKQDYRAALADCDRVIAKWPGHKGAYHLKAVASFYLGDLQTAVESINLADQQDINVLRWKRALAFDSGSFTETAKLVCDSRNPRLEWWDFDQLAFAYGMDGNYSAALGAVLDGIRHATNQQDLFAAYAEESRYLLHLGRFDEAIKSANLSIAIADKKHNCFGDPFLLKTDPWLYRAEAELAQRDYQNAYLDASHAINSHFNSGRAYRLRAEILDKLGKTPEAARDRQKAAFFGSAPYEQI